MNTLNLLLLRLIEDRPDIIINSGSSGLIQQIRSLCMGSELNPVTASIEEMQSVVFIISNVSLPPFSFLDISNVWIDGGQGKIQLRKIYQTFTITESLAKILLEFKDLGCWISDCSFSLTGEREENDKACAQGINDRLDFLNSDNRFSLLSDLIRELGHLMLSKQYEKPDSMLTEIKNLTGELTPLYQKKFGSEKSF